MEPTDFKRRYYRNLRELFRDTSAILRQRKLIKPLMRGELISDSFRERIMLAVTEVNGCRYCQYAHAKMALDAGLDPAEIDSLSAGVFNHCPPDEVPALLYAQHWAETDAKPDDHTRQQVLDNYGEEKTRSMELAMRMIRIGNLMGNSWDYFLYKISFGRLGNATQT